MSRSCSSLKPDEQVVFKIYSDIYKEKIPTYGNVTSVNTEKRTVDINWLEGYKDRNDTIAYEDMLAVYNPDGEEMKFDKVAKKAVSIVTGKKVNLTEEQSKTLTQTIVDSIKANGTMGSITVDTKLKPFVDIVTEPFKFIMSAANLPFKLVKSVINLVTSPVQKKAAQAA